MSWSQQKPLAAVFTKRILYKSATDYFYLKKCHDWPPASEAVLIMWSHFFHLVSLLSWVVGIRICGDFSTSSRGQSHRRQGWWKTSLVTDWYHVTCPVRYSAPYWLSIKHWKNDFTDWASLKWSTQAQWSLKRVQTISCAGSPAQNSLGVCAGDQLSSRGNDGRDSWSKSVSS